MTAFLDTPWPYIVGVVVLAYTSPTFRRSIAVLQSPFDWACASVLARVLRVGPLGRGTRASSHADKGGTLKLTGCDCPLSNLTASRDPRFSERVVYRCMKCHATSTRFVAVDFLGARQHEQRVADALAH